MNIELKPAKVKTLFLDIGGVILSNGWGRDFRRKAEQKFGLDPEETEERHHLTFDTYEEGKLSLDDYLNRVFFYKKNNFTKDEFKEFMFAQSYALQENLDYFLSLRKQYKLKVIAVSNEGRELNEHRIKKFKLNELFDAYISSCYVHLRKPDKDMLSMACDISQTKPEEGLYVDDRLMFVEVARSYGIPSLHFEDLEKAKTYISKLTFYTDKLK